MKRKEREHLKEDPFAAFIETVLNKFSELKKEILTILGVIVLIGIIIVVVLFLRSSSVDSDNTVFSKAIAIRQSNDLSTDQKLAQLKNLKPGKGLSSTINFYIASLHYENKNYDQALLAINKGKESKYNYLNDERNILKAEILIAKGGKTEGIKILEEILFRGSSEIPKDFLLIKIAKYQIALDKKEAAKENLKKLTNEYPESIYNREAAQLIQRIK